MERFSLGAEKFIVGAFWTWEGAGHCPGRGCGQALGGGPHPGWVLSLRLLQAFGSLLATRPSPLPLPWPKTIASWPQWLSSLTSCFNRMCGPPAVTETQPTFPTSRLPLAVSSAQITLSLMSCPQVFSVLQGSGSVSPPRKVRALFLSPAPLSPSLSLPVALLTLLNCGWSLHLYGPGQPWTWWKVSLETALHFLIQHWASGLRGRGGNTALLWMEENLRLSCSGSWVEGNKMKCPERPVSHCHAMAQTTLLF